LSVLEVAAQGIFELYWRYLEVCWRYLGGVVPTSWRLRGEIEVVVAIKDKATGVQLRKGGERLDMN
jgi:hypothetical protein